MSTFRKEYRKLTAEEQLLVEQIKNEAELLELLFQRIPGRPDSYRHAALAMTKLEESVMWAVKGVTG